MIQVSKQDISHSRNETVRASQALSIVSLSDHSAFQFVLQPRLQKPYHPTEL